MSITGTTEKYCYVLNDERYGGCTLIRDWDRFVGEMVGSRYNEGIRRQALAEREEELFDAAEIVRYVRLHDDSIVWATADDDAYRAVDNGDAAASPASYAGNVADLLAVEEA